MADIDTTSQQASLQEDAALAQAIMMQSMLSSPYFGGAGAVLSITATPFVFEPPAEGEHETPEAYDEAIREHVREIDDSVPRRFTFQVVQQQASPEPAPPSLTAGPASTRVSV